MSQDKPDSTPAVRQTNQSFFFESDIFSRRPPDRAPRASRRRGARSRPAPSRCSATATCWWWAAARPARRRRSPRRAPAPMSCCWSATTIWAGSPPAVSSIWIDRMTDWSGAQVIRGIANDLLDRLPKDAIAGPPRGLWGSADAATAAYWRERTAAYHGIVTWSPTHRSGAAEARVSQELVLESGVHLLLHGLGCAPIMEDGAVAGVVFESKEGRLRDPRPGDGGLHRRRRHLRPRRRRCGHRHRGARHPPLHEHVLDLGRRAT